jgi:hypothetical protein
MAIHASAGLRRSLVSASFGLAIALIILSGPTRPASAAAPSDVVRVEQDWKLVVTTPDVNSCGPQVSTVMSPIGHVQWRHMTFEINHQTNPTFVAGGMQLQSWWGEWSTGTHKSPHPAVMSTDNETVEWTQSMEIVSEGLKFEITDGTSTTWGQFGGQGYLKTTVPTLLHNLNGYSTNVSVENSGVTFGANLVGMLVLQRVRIFTANGQVQELATSRVVYVQD